LKVKKCCFEDVERDLKPGVSLGGQTADQGRGPSHGGELRRAAGVVAGASPFK
jgi:hypothetical protein